MIVIVIDCNDYTVLAYHNRNQVCKSYCNRNGNHGAIISVIILITYD